MQIASLAWGHSILQHGGQVDVSVGNAGVITLQVDGPWLCWIGEDCSAGWAIKRLFVDHLFAIEHYGDVPVDERQLIFGRFVRSGGISISATGVAELTDGG